MLCPLQTGSATTPRADGKASPQRPEAPNLAVVAEDPSTTWTPITVANWYGKEERSVEIISDTAVWHSTALPAVPLRWWVLIGDPHGEFKTPVTPLHRSERQPEADHLLVHQTLGRWRPPSKRCEDAWGLRPRGIGPKEQSGGVPLRCVSLVFSVVTLFAHQHT